MGKYTRRAWQSSPRSRAATVWLGRCNRWPLSAGPWQQGGCRVGTVVRSGAQAWALCSPRANSVTPSLPAHLPVCLQGQLPGTPGSLFPLPRSQPLSRGGARLRIHSHPCIHSHPHSLTHTHIHSLTYSLTPTYSLTLTYSLTPGPKAQPHRPGHCFHPRTVLSQRTLT